MIILATISTNTAANIVSPTNVFQNIAPKLINENRGVLITGVIGIAADELGAAEENGLARDGRQRREPLFELAASATPACSAPSPAS